MGPDVWPAYDIFLALEFKHPVSFDSKNLILFQSDHWMKFIKMDVITHFLCIV